MPGVLGQQPENGKKIRTRNFGTEGGGEGSQARRDNFCLEFKERVERIAGPDEKIDTCLSVGKKNTTHSLFIEIT